MPIAGAGAVGFPPQKEPPSCCPLGVTNVGCGIIPGWLVDAPGRLSGCVGKLGT